MPNIYNRVRAAIAKRELDAKRAADKAHDKGLEHSVTDSIDVDQGSGAIEVRFYTLVGKFAELRRESFASMFEARAAIERHAASAGYTNVKPVDDADSVRYTARTPGGRGGRNIAHIDLF